MSTSSPVARGPGTGRPPVDPTTHGAIDYGFAAANLLAPSLFGLTGSAKALCYLFGTSQGLLNALTDHPLGVNRIIPFRTHGRLETPFVASLVLLPLLSGALKQRNARAYLLSFFGIAYAHYMLTDYDAYERNGGAGRADRPAVEGETPTMRGRSVLVTAES
ncbi:MAG: hypothetical protein JWO31_58 [Phycisphaerales bacterium]|nr:hypothetical protein [Phycisphaerales bacterium]